ncbi:MAG: hypothetical protein AB7Q17_11865 [Phycisphaerae bacterium]
MSYATSYTFQPSSGDWNTPEHWDPTGVPGVGDTATIPDGKTCVIAAANQACSQITIAAGGTHGVVGKDLSMQTSGGLSSQIKIHGTMYFDEASSVVPRLMLVSNTTIFADSGSSGVVTARATDGYGPGIIRPTSSSVTLTVGQGITMRGSLRFNATSTLELTIDLDHSTATIQTNHASDTLDIGEVADVGERVILIGDGKLDCSAGSLRIGYAASGSQFSTTGRVLISGGTFQVSQYALFANVNAKLELSGGVLDIDSPTSFIGDFVCAGGKLKVAPDVAFVAN